VAYKPFQSWPTGLVLSFAALVALLAGLISWMYTLQGQFQEQERQSQQRRRQGLVASGRALAQQNETLLRERAAQALRRNEAHELLLGWVDPTTGQIAVNAPQPDFGEALAADPAAGEAEARWTALLESGEAFPSGFPKRLVATVEIAKSGAALQPAEAGAWVENMARLWHNADDLDLVKLYTLLSELPETARRLFAVHLKLLCRALELCAAEGDFVEAAGKTGLIDFPAEAWDGVRDSLESMGLALEPSAPGETSRVALQRDATDLTRKHARERQFFALSCALLAGLLALIALAIRTMVNAHQRRQTLLHAVSHEFRTPLASVLQFSEMLLEKRYASPEKAELYLRCLHNEGLRLQSLLENVLAFARIEKRLFKIHPQRTEMTAFLRDLEKQITLPDPFFAEHLRFEIDHGPCEVLLDQEAFVKVVRNLLDNAKKHGRPPIRAHAGVQNDAWVLTIRDEGPGLDDAAARTLFKPRPRKPAETSAGGIGLGLRLVKSIVDSHQGSLEFKPNRPRGLCVVVKLQRIDEGTEP